MSSNKKVRILLAKAGPDTHVRGLSILMVRLRDAGMETIYSGLYQTPETVVAAAIQEDVDFIFLSSHLGRHMALAEQIMALLKEKGAEHISLAVGGVIPPRDFARLKEMGVKGAFQPHTLTSTVIDFVRSQTTEVTKK
ncbi:MAG: cobalamin-dependent protein [Dehalococcoidia bacterium]|nr:cobalamin-dependent protein [Dehalococcoidia bacterium]